ncbi:MAG: hypothetical protein NZT92_10395 [Abditibacteriales bacterium]|nr:hypothetical protein [Abditibacteriales bacterium]MDW8365567.1 hypothetical protein [Abditibacteriales bacterium]
MSEKTLRAELEQLLSGAPRLRNAPLDNGSAPESVAERNLRRMLQATYGLADEMLAPETANAMLAALLRATNGQPVAQHRADVNEHPNGWHASSLMRGVTTPAPAPKSSLRSRLAPRWSPRLAVLLSLLLLLAAVAGAMWLPRWLGNDPSGEVTSHLIGGTKKGTPGLAPLFVPFPEGQQDKSCGIPLDDKSNPTPSASQPTPPQTRLPSLPNAGSSRR